jgi:hypothetical protein
VKGIERMRAASHADAVDEWPCGDRPLDLKNLDRFGGANATIKGGIR